MSLKAEMDIEKLLPNPKYKNIYDFLESFRINSSKVVSELDEISELVDSIDFKVVLNNSSLMNKVSDF